MEQVGMTAEKVTVLSAEAWILRLGVRLPGKADREFNQD